MKIDSIDKYLLISLKPKFAKKIFKGEKTVELRKSGPQKINKGGYVLIYVTSPVKELWGMCKIDNIISNSPSLLWNQIGERTGITKKEFNHYYKDTQKAFGIEISEVINFNNNSIQLEALRNIIPGFSPPQTYRYIDKHIIDNNLIFQTQA